MISFEEAAEFCDRAALRILDHRLSTMGTAESGLYDFYEARLRQGRIIQDYELAVGQFVLGLTNAPSVVEVGSGIGILACSLAATGRRTFSVEGDGRRIAAQQALIDGIEQDHPGRLKALTVCAGVFPDVVVPEGPKVALFTNLVAGQSETVTRDIIKALRGYDYIVFDALRFFNRYTIEAGSPVLGWFRDEGYDPGLVQIDMGDTGQYYLIRS